MEPDKCKRCGGAGYLVIVENGNPTNILGREPCIQCNSTGDMKGKNDCYKPPYLLEDWRDKPLEKLSKEELIEALKSLWKGYQASTASQTRFIGDLGSMISRSAPRSSWLDKLFGV